MEKKIHKVQCAVSMFQACKEGGKCKPQWGEIQKCHR